MFNQLFPLNKVQIIGIVIIIIALILGVIFFINMRIEDSEKKGDEHCNEDKEDKTLFDKIVLFGSMIFLTTCLFISTFVIQFTHVESGSMEPTIMTGDFTIVNRLAYFKNEPQRGDIVAFKSYEYRKYLLKRIIGIPGDTIEFHNGNVYINGQMYEESDYLDPSIETYCDKIFTVPADSYFMLGDNRYFSIDSRFFKQPYIKNQNWSDESFILLISNSKDNNYSMRFHWKFKH